MGIKVNKDGVVIAVWNPAAQELPCPEPAEGRGFLGEKLGKQQGA